MRLFFVLLLWDRICQCERVENYFQPSGAVQPNVIGEYIESFEMMKVDTVQVFVPVHRTRWVLLKLLK